MGTESSNNSGLGSGAGRSVHYSGATARIQVVRWRPGAWFWWLLPFLSVAITAMGYFAGHRAGQLAADPLARMDEVRDAFDAQQMRGLQEQVTALKLERTVEVTAAEHVQASLRDLQEEVAALEEEVTFYRRLMAPEELSKGLHIERFVLRQRPGTRAFGYEVVIAQTVARHGWQRGELSIDVIGRRDRERSGSGDGAAQAESAGGGRQVLPLTEIASLPSYPLQFRFRYFQNFAGELTLPANFIPEAVQLTLDRSAESPITERFDWQVAPRDLATSRRGGGASR